MDCVWFVKRLKRFKVVVFVDVIGMVLFVFVDSFIVVVLGIVIVCDFVFVVFLEILLFSDVDVYIFGVVEDEILIVMLDELMLFVFVVFDDKVVMLLIGVVVLFSINFFDVIWKLVISDIVCIVDGLVVMLLFGNVGVFCFFIIDVEVEVLVVEVVFEDFFIVVIWVIIRVIWRICNDECILIFRKVCGKRDEKGFV